MMTGCNYGAFSAGVMLGVASILSVGPNNLMLMREGLMRGRVGLAATLVFASYLSLLTVALCLTDLLAHEGFVRSLMIWSGLIAVCWFSLKSFQAAIQSRSILQINHQVFENLSSCVRRIGLLVWLNPLTYVDLVLMPGSMCGSFQDYYVRLQFISGLMIVALMTCYGYAFGGGLLTSLFSHRRFIQIFDMTSGVVLSCIAVVMATGLLLRTD